MNLARRLWESTLGQVLMLTVLAVVFVLLMMRAMS